ncbi:MAG: ATP-dependent DNA helicase RecG, partial [Ktedonobacteraceae bacterium]
MSNTSPHVLAPYVERARKVLQHEQRTHHQDQAIKPGGLEVFVGRWADEMSALCKNAGLDLRPVHDFAECLQGYRKQDPMQRAASLRAALAILNELDALGNIQNDKAPVSTSQPLAALNGGGGEAVHGIAPKHRTPLARPVTTTRIEEPGNARTTEATHYNGDGKKPAQATTPITNNNSDGKKATTVTSKSDGKKPAQTNGRAEPAPQRIRLEAGMTPGHTVLTLLSADITAVPKVGPAAATRLRSLGIRTVRDLLFYFPRDHRDYSKLEKIANLPFNEVTTTKGLIWEVKSAPTKGGRTRTIATITDDTGKLNVTWFNQPYLIKQLKNAQGSWLVVTGTKQRFGNKIEFSVRSHELPEEGDLLNTGRLVPTYALTEGLHANALRRYTKWVVDHYAAMVPDHLPASIRSAGKLMPLPDAVSHIHYPENEAALAAARRRLAFDELFLIQLGMQERRTRWQREAPEGNAFKIENGKIFIDASQADGTAQDGEEQAVMPYPFNGTLWSPVLTNKPFEASLPFRFTAAQRRVIGEILADLAQNRPMCRLLQGDVGAGKTAVAAAALLCAAFNGYQGAMMAPTELLAEQHARSISVMLEPFGIRTVLLTGSLKQRERVLGRTAIESGEAMVAIGTHALIQEDVNFQRLGLVIVDEQHRFGVEQRDALRQKGYHPHMLVMTATPIPRTLALTLYGDLDVSVIDQLPPGRQKIITRWRTGARRSEAYTLIAHQVAEGHQAFIICPLIEESE